MNTSFQNASTAAICVAYTGVVVAFMFSYWGIAIAIFGIFFLMVISVLKSLNVEMIIPIVIIFLLSGYYLNLCHWNGDRIKKNDMPDGWVTHHTFFIFFMLVSTLCLQFELGFGVISAPLAFMFLFLVMQYTLAVNFRTEGMKIK